ncbi:hypothetical protein D3C86_1751560 [compost metagenome]
MNSRVAGITPPSPCTGSSMMPTVLSVISFSTEARSFSSALGKPGTCGAKMVSQPALPDALMVASVRPWKLWSMVMISYAPFLCLRPHLRASLMAPSLASAPLLAKKTLSKQLWSVSCRASLSIGSL